MRGTHTMAYRDVNNPKVLCPYYIYFEGQKVVCEGMAEGANNTIRFADLKSRNKWIRANCQRDWKDCPLKRAIDLKYYPPTAAIKEKE